MKPVTVNLGKMMYYTGRHMHSQWVSCY